MKLDGYSIEKRLISVSEYQELRSTTSWHHLSDEQVEVALSRDLFSVVVLFDTSVVGMGRVIGDGAIYFYLQDIIVHPEHQGNGVGRLIMNAIETFLSSAIQTYGFVGLMAADGTIEFYKSFGFEERFPNGPGMQKVITTF